MTVVQPSNLAVAPHATVARSGFVRKYLFDDDHKSVGLRHLFLGLGFFVLGGLLAMLMRWQLAYGTAVPVVGRLMGWADGRMPPDAYNATLSIHGTVMIFFVIIPLLVGAFGNYLIPLIIGARGTAFPMLGGLSVWLTVVAGVVLLAGWWLPGGPVAAGWTGYPPLSALWGAGATPDTAWPAVPRAMAFAAIVILIGYVCSKVVRWRPGAVDNLIGVVVSLAGAFVFLRAIETVAFDGQSSWFLTLMIFGVASLMTAINFLATILAMRCPGMTLFRMPLTVWAMLFTSILILLATPVLAGAMLLNLLDHHRLTSFFLPANWYADGRAHAGVAGGGYAVLHQHLFWFYSHPAVYVMILPAFGMVSDILGVFARKPVFGYRAMVTAMGAITFLGFFVWAHHMFVSGMNPALATGFAISTMLIAVPSGVKVFNWLGTLWGGDIHFTTAMCNAVAFVSLFVIGGLSGIFLASTPVNVHVHGTAFVVAHLHYVLFGGSTFGLFAAIYFWYPKFTGRMMSERLGKVHFALSFVAFNCVFFPMHILGLRGLPRRVADYTNYPGFADLRPMNVFITVSAFCLGVAQLPFAWNFIYSWFRGRPAPANPWRATTLEWTDAASPPRRDNFESTPVVYRGPYEYNNPLAKGDFWPQSQKEGSGFITGVVTEPEP